MSIYEAQEKLLDIWAVQGADQPYQKTFLSFIDHMHE